MPRVIDGEECPIPVCAVHTSTLTAKRHARHGPEVAPPASSWRRPTQSCRGTTRQQDDVTANDRRD